MNSGKLFGENVKKFRSDLGINELNFAARVFITGDSLKNIEAGRLPSLDLAVRIVNQLSTGMNECFAMDESFNKYSCIQNINKKLPHLDQKQLDLLLRIVLILNNKVDDKIG